MTSSRWTPRGLLDRAGADGVTIFDAVDKQLGLKLTLQTAPRQMLLVDSVSETPTPNVPGLEKIMPPASLAQIDALPSNPPLLPDEKSWFSIKGYQMNIQAIPLKYLVAFAWDLNGNDSEAIQGAPQVAG